MKDYSIFIFSKVVWCSWRCGYHRPKTAIIKWTCPLILTSSPIFDWAPVKSSPIIWTPVPANIRLDKDVLKTSLVFVFKTSSSRPIYSYWSYVFKTSSRRFQDVFKTSSRCLQDVFKTSSRRLAKTSSRHLQDVLKTSLRRIANMTSRPVQDVSLS